MITEVLVMDGNNEAEKLERAAEVIRSGGLVAFPTETVYGLGANALDEKAAEKIYEAKGRPSDNPLIVHIARIQELETVAEQIPDVAWRLAEAFWPGPMTMVLKKKSRIPARTTGGLDTVAVRLPDDETARELIRRAGVPIAAPSANTSGRPSPTTAEHVKDDMNGRIEMILDGGPVGIGVESTIVDVTGEIPVILRPGAVTSEMLEALVGRVDVDPAIMKPMNSQIRPKAPGMRYRHYAPRGALTLVKAEIEGNAQAVTARICQLAEEAICQGKKTGIIGTDETKEIYEAALPGALVKSAGSRAKKETVAHNLYRILREFDDEDTDCIFAEAFSEDHLGQAIMNRLNKAAGYHIVKV